MRSPRSRAWVVAACLTACVVPLHAQPVGSAPVTTGVADGPVYSLPALIELARRDSPALAAARARVSGADAGRTTARARPNPEIEFQAGRQSASGGAISGASGAFGVLQPLERGALREARLDAATALAETVPPAMP